MDKAAERRVLVLTDLFNVLPDARIRLKLLLDTLAYAQKASLAGLVAPTVKVGCPCLEQAGPISVQKLPGSEPTSLRGKCDRDPDEGTLLDVR